MEENELYLKNPHVVPAGDVLKHYAVTLDYGLTDEQVERHRTLFGSHTFVKPKKVSLLYLFVTQFDDLLVKILLSAALISFLLTLFDPNEKAHISSFIEPIVILVILVLNAIVGVWQEANAERALEALKKLQPSLAHCLRSGVWSTIDTEELVVGDIVKVKNGDKIPSDVRVVKVVTTSLLVEQSQLTGESFLIYKTTDALPRDKENCELQSKTNILFGSTTVCSGTALGVVVATGMRTEIGAIQSAVIEASSETTSTPLQKMLNEFGTNLSKAISVVCVIVWAINFKNFSDPVHGTFLRGCIYYFKIAIALAVAAIPEGLPAVITTCLALGTRKMAKRNAIVRKLPSIETLGCTTVICSDKTGTLTTNRMTGVVLNLFNNQHKIRYIHMPPTQKGADQRPSKGRPRQFAESDGIRVTMGGFGETGMCVAQSFDGPIECLTHAFLKCASLCSDVTVNTSSSHAKATHRKKDVNLCDQSGLILEGEPTEVAIIELVNNFGHFLKGCDSVHLDEMGRLIYGSASDELRPRRKRLFRRALLRRSLSSSADTTPVTSSEISRRGSLRDDAATVGSSAPGSPQSHMPSSPSFSPKSSRLSGLGSSGSLGAATPTALLYRKYLRKEATLEFCRSRKMMSVIAREDIRGPGNLFVFTKGAPESVLDVCVSHMLPDGTVAKLGREQREEVARQVSLLANEALRVLAFAFREASAKDLEAYKALSAATPKAGANPASNFAKIERDLTFLGLVGIMDPPRPEVKNAISRCMRAGIRVIMITGDNKLTAEAIARKIGIIKPTVATTLNNYNLEAPAQSKLLGFLKDARPPTARDAVKTTRSSSTSSVFASLTGKEFESLSPESQKKLLSNTCLVFSRTEPKHKQQIVSILKELGEIVAMTGDGVNDAPALKMADIGISMGINGTEVAKEASDMILADDNFRTIVSAIEEGRCIYSNMKAFIRYLISSNIGEVVSIFMTAMLGIPEGMVPVQLLWVNLVTDGPPATALSFNPPDPLVMKKQPRSKDDKLIDRLTLVRYLVIGAYVGLATVGIFVMYFVRGVSPHEGNTLVTFSQLRDWGSCQDWPHFVANNVYDMEVSCDYFTLGKIKACTLSLSTLVTLEMFNAFNALSEDSSLLAVPPWRNMYLIFATAFSMFIHCVILYVPFLAQLFNVVPLDAHDWKWVLIWSFPVILIDELMKLVFKAYKRGRKPRLRYARIRRREPRHPKLKIAQQPAPPAAAEPGSAEGKFWSDASSKQRSTSFGSRLSTSMSSLLERVNISLTFSRSSSGSSGGIGSQPTSDSEEELREAPKLAT